jgi:hypothetical protein
LLLPFPQGQANQRQVGSSQKQLDATAESGPVFPEGSSPLFFVSRALYHVTHQLQYLHPRYPICHMSVAADLSGRPFFLLMEGVPTTDVPLTVSLSFALPSHQRDHAD